MRVPLWRSRPQVSAAGPAPGVGYHPVPTWRLEWGIIRFQPGQELGAHKHEEVEETFYFEEGTPLMVANGEQYRVVAGDVFRLEPGESHNIINDTDADTRLIFIKCPYVPGDKIALEQA